ncbi:hypothetical protein OESDEN_22345 [Oesophagostomum dentatum]|uniref:Uncharacterized protein n=1 Tax=Oesophagostomum dentatum TaxID=61180 RepID=A0A0B1S477_OESDE|nr:hypothetical protein OESDEN_22345 [Oesophagostomum dentatum]
MTQASLAFQLTSSILEISGSTACIADLPDKCACARVVAEILHLSQRVRTMRTISFATRDETEATQASDSTKQVDLNDFILKAAADNLIVHPSLVTKKGNIDTAMFRAKTKEEIMELDEAMKSGPSSERERPAQPVQKDKNSMQKPMIKWGDSKSVVYETTSQPTYDDDEVMDEPDLYLC